ncbi:MAG: lipoate--protein ligase family protein, partial [Cyanobacteria bacterium P01_G01_bin.49]
MSKFPSTWRFIPLIKTSGKIQMAIDNWLFEQQEESSTIPTLRFYTWSKPTISIGRLQRKYPENWHHLTWND